MVGQNTHVVCMQRREDVRPSTDVSNTRHLCVKPRVVHNDKGPIIEVTVGRLVVDRVSRCLYVVGEAEIQRLFKFCHSFTRAQSARLTAITSKMSG